jgi:hypothetical protein
MEGSIGQFPEAPPREGAPSSPSETKAVTPIVLKVLSEWEESINSTPIVGMLDL